MIEIIHRPRRNRKSATIRALIEETRLSVKDFVFPLFVEEGKNVKHEISAMPGIFRYSTDTLMDEIAECNKLGINAFALFPSLSEKKKDKMATESSNPEGLYIKAIEQIKKNFPDVCLISDVAMDPYSSDGHDGLYENGKILNDESLNILGKMALEQAKAGADIIAPSDMMDGRVAYIRRILDDNCFTDVSIMSYTAKYASSFYGPFRSALNSQPKVGDKKTYQMNPANVREALYEAELDYAEGADMMMVKPALSYLDVIKSLHENFTIPIAAFNVSGEYAMIKAAAQAGWLDGDAAMIETLLSIRRAGATIIFSYFAKDYAKLKIV